jgi:two-component system sensor histidine kinase KdpD
VFQKEVRLEFTENEPGQDAPGPWKIPLRGSQGILGEMELQSTGPQAEPSPAQRRLMEAFASQTAQAIERIRLAERARQVKMMQDTERLQTALLNSISHDLRTPLVSITGSLSTLREDSIALDAELHRSLVDTAYQEAVRMNRLVANLLNMTRLEAGAMKVVKRLEDVQDVVGAALEPLNERLANRPVKIQVPAELPLVPMDFVLMLQVLVNLIDNALKYSPEGSPVDIQAFHNDQNVEIWVQDRGSGIPEPDLERVFDKFYQVQPEGKRLRPSTGLGLSICRGIVEAHQGSIRAENRPGGGATIKIVLPLE